MTLGKLQDRISECMECGLCKTRNNIVLGEGDASASVIFIGEAPGRNEDLEGKPFVGRAGSVLNQLLNFINVPREDVYITNVVKCRPPGNRKPRKGEIRTCTQYLDLELRIVEPRIICPLGNYATSYVMREYGLKDELKRISDLHGKVFTINTLQDRVRIIPLYHPAASIYNPGLEEVMKEDMKVVKKYLS